MLGFIENYGKGLKRINEAYNDEEKKPVLDNLFIVELPDLNLNNKTRYSKYDNIVSNHLHYYVEIILNDKAFKKRHIKLNNKSSDDNILSVYNTYASYIGKIINEANKNCTVNNLNRNTFGHLVWYGFK